MKYKAKIRAINIKSSESTEVAEHEISQEEIEALIAAKFVHDHKIQDRDNMIFRAKLEGI